jgi:hypothetical protein
MALRGALGLVACCLLLGCTVSSQSEWKRITPVERGHNMPQPNQRDAATPVQATRLIFEYDGDNVRLVMQQSVEVAAATLREATGEEAGIFVDARDRAERTLARVAAPDAFNTSVEVFPEQHDQPITRTEVPRSTGAFTVVVPTPEETDHATVVRIARTLGGSREAAASAPSVSDLVSFPLHRNR